MNNLTRRRHPLKHTKLQTNTDPQAAPRDIGHLYKVALNHEGSHAINGAENTELQVRNETREGAWKIYLIS